MEIIVQGHKIDTKEIWDIEFDCNSYDISLEIKLIDKPSILLQRSGLVDKTSEFKNNIKNKYERIYKAVKEKWEADKTDIEIFKL